MHIWISSNGSEHLSMMLGDKGQGGAFEMHVLGLIDYSELKVD